MARYPTGAEITNEIERIELKYLLKNGFIKKDKTAHGSMAWTSGNKVSFISKYTTDEAYFLLYYKIVSTGKEYFYKIHLTKVASNLGVGEVLYFVCPETQKRCRILYRAYGSKTWKSRFAYKQRIYYKSQIASGFWSCLNRYEETGKLLTQLTPTIKKQHYKGRLTVPQKRANYLINRRKQYRAKLEELKSTVVKSPADIELVNDLLATT